ncbi:GNAT family N-acetyltransferase [Kribbella sancticallisti]|uniref:GNAT family N-acetyltransferase n=1 Tax=Kribbella sancticallisti TaxID=460087 RepID=A0ABP4N259_9ACTN
MGFEIRSATPADATGIAGVWAAAMPQLVKTAKGVEAELRGSTRRVVLIATEPGVVGFGNVYLPDPQEREPRLRVTVQVPPAQRGRGIGSALYQAIERAAQDAGAAKLLIVVSDDDRSKDFAIRHGFTIGRRMTHAKADLAEVPAPAPVPPGLQLVDFDDLQPAPLWVATSAVADGDPSGLSHVPEYDDWVRMDWNHPDLRRDLSMALVADGIVVSFVTTAADPDRKVIWSNLTGTVPTYRGRGLAKVVKSAALSRSREAGFLTAYTGNDADNQPMLAVNKWLGYQPTAAAWTAEKVL